MKYLERRSQTNEEYAERLNLVMGRIFEIAENPELKEPFSHFFQEQAKHLMVLYELTKQTADLAFDGFSEEQAKDIQNQLFGMLFPETYETGVWNPSYAQEIYGEDYGPLFTALAAKLCSFYPSLYEGVWTELCIYAELFVEIYHMFADEDGCSAKQMKEVMYSFMHDYTEIFCEQQISRLLDPQNDYVRHILMDADLTNPRYLYKYGLFVGDNERQMASFLNCLSEKEIQDMADTFTEGYRIGFEVTGKDIRKKSVVELRYPIGFERMVCAAVKNFETMNLQAVLKPYSTQANQQFVFDHREDRALWLDKSYVERELEVYRTVFEKYKQLARGYGGPAVIEVFGEEPFSPLAKETCQQYDEKQKKLAVYEKSTYVELFNKYIIGEERSFTIIAYPLPSIGSQFEEIFRETVKINTLDYQLYQEMQQKIIDVLDTADVVHIKGKGKNKTDLFVNIYPLTDLTSQTAFENCVADVNIPVGEVFTTPVLEGTHGKLHVSQVYLNELCYKELELDFEDGMITSYTCQNFEQEEKNKKYIEDHVLHHHKTLPMGEFAIGTNTTAYRMGREYHIEDKLPILIAEKTGPHFAVGDSCYTYDEDNMTYNPDGKAIVARDNSISIQRKTDVSKAYFHCHTDITIPYDELDSITVIDAKGTQIDIIKDGKFVVPGTEILNQPLELL